VRIVNRRLSENFLTILLGCCSIWNHTLSKLWANSLASPYSLYSLIFPHPSSLTKRHNVSRSMYEMFRRLSIDHGSIQPQRSSTWHVNRFLSPWGALPFNQYRSHSSKRRRVSYSLIPVTLRSAINDQTPPYLQASDEGSRIPSFLSPWGALPLNQYRSHSKKRRRVSFVIPRCFVAYLSIKAAYDHSAPQHDRLEWIPGMKINHEFTRIKFGQSHNSLFSLTLHLHPVILYRYL